MSIASDWRPRVIAALLVVAAVLFVIGVTSESEKDMRSDQPSAEVAGHSEGGESSQGRASEAAEANGEAEPNESTERKDGDEGRVLGLDLESPAPVALAVVLSAALALGVLWRPDRRALVVVAVVAAAFAVLDIAEVSHRLDDDQAELAALAATIAVLHAATAALAVWYVTDRAPASRAA